MRIHALNFFIWDLLNTFGVVLSDVRNKLVQTLNLDELEEIIDVVFEIFQRVFLVLS